MLRAHMAMSFGRSAYRVNNPESSVQKFVLERAPKSRDWQQGLGGRKTGSKFLGLALDGPVSEQMRGLVRSYSSVPHKHQMKVV